MTSPPNLFDYATKELSQDAVICWLIDWAGRETSGEPEDEKLRQCGLAFVKGAILEVAGLGLQALIWETLSALRSGGRRKGSMCWRALTANMCCSYEDKTKTGSAR